MRSVKLLIVAAMCLLPVSQLRADDFGLWPELGFTKSYGKHFSWGMEGGLRTGDHFGNISRMDIGVELSYKPVKYFRIGGGYTLIFDWEPIEVKEHYNKRGRLNGYNIDRSFWRPKNRFYVDVAGKLPLGRFTLTLRERYQYTSYPRVSYEREKYRGLVSDDYDGHQYNGYALEEVTTEEKDFKEKHYLRSKLTAEYNIRHCPVTPFISAEVSNNLSDGFSIVKQRYTAGIDWKIQKSHVITVGYIYTHGHDDDVDGDIHAISIGYNYKF